MSRGPKATADVSAAREDVLALTKLGIVAGARHCLTVGPEGLAEAVRSEWTPTALDSAILDQAGAALAPTPSGSADLVVTSGVLGVGTVAEAAQMVRGLVAALAPGGRLAAVIDTYATRVRDEAVGPDDLMLFPDLATTGHLGAVAETRTPLTPTAWLALLAGAGVSITATAGYGEAPPEADTLSRHAARLAPFDHREIATGRLLVLAQKVGGAS